jgi:hypothetical protein
MFRFVKDCADRDFILKWPEKAEATFAKVMHPMTNFQKQIGINADDATMDIFSTKLPAGPGPAEKSR